MTFTAPIYLLPGMTPNDHLFDGLMALLPSARIVNWVDPLPDESLSAYAGRIAATIPSPQCFIAGVSFGGIVALEVSRIIQPHACFLISSIRHPNQLPPWLWMSRILAGRNCQRVLNTAGQLAVSVPKPIRTRSTTRITKLAGEAGSWHRWATSAVLGWQPEPANAGVPVIQIHGDADTTFPIRYVTPDVVVPSGGHVLPLTHPTAVAAAMKSRMASTAGGFLARGWQRRPAPD